MQTLYHSSGKLGHDKVGTSESFYELYDRYFRVMVGYAIRFVKTDVIAEDIVQEVFTSLWDKRNELTDDSNLVRLLYVSVRNRSIDHLKHENVKRAYSSSVTLESTADIEESIFTGEVYARLFEYIDKLPERQRDTLLLVIEGKKNAEIAAQMGVSIETVKHQKSKAINALRALFSAEDKVAMFSLLNILIMN